MGALQGAPNFMFMLLFRSLFSGGSATRGQEERFYEGGVGRVELERLVGSLTGYNMIWYDII